MFPWLLEYTRPVFKYPIICSTLDLKKPWRLLKERLLFRENRLLFLLMGGRVVGTNNRAWCDVFCKQTNPLDST